VVILILGVAGVSFTTVAGIIEAISVNITDGGGIGILFVIVRVNISPLLISLSVFCVSS